MTPAADSPGGGLDALDLLGGLVLESGALWGEVATEHQRADAAALLSRDPAAPRMHYQTRPRGGSKTTDAAGVALAALVTQAPPRSTSHAYARDLGQAGLLVDAMAALVGRTGLGSLVDVAAGAVTMRASRARLVVESADAASAYGHLPWLVIADELAQWPTTREARALWEALVSGLPKRADSRLAVLTTAGDPVHWSAAVLAGARTSPAWRVSEMPGPVPWVSPDDLAEQRRLLPASAYARLHLNLWTAAEDRLVSPDDLAACVTLDGPQDPDPRHRYVIGLDLGLKNDRTVLAVCHSEPVVPDPAHAAPTASRYAPPPQRVVLDRMHVLAGTAAAPVQLADIEALAYEAATAYRAPIRFDPWQAIGLGQRLTDRGVRADPWGFTATSVGHLAATLHLLLREHRLALPPEAALLDELGTVRLRESAPGVYRMDHDANAHDDRAVALGLAALALTERSEVGRGSVTVPGAASGRPVIRATHDARPALPSRFAVARAARGMPRGLPGGGIAPPSPSPRRRR